MDLYDKLALSMRRYEPRQTMRTHERRFELVDLIEMYSKDSILELTSAAPGGKSSTHRPDDQRKLKVSLLDSVSDLELPADAWFRVAQTPPSGDYSRARIKAYGRGNERLGEIKLLIGRRSYDYYFADDPVLGQIDSDAAVPAVQAVPPTNGAPAQEAQAGEAPEEEKAAT
jgi:hypothetical protein